MIRGDVSAVTPESPLDLGLNPKPAALGLALYKTFLSGRG